MNEFVHTLFFSLGLSAVFVFAGFCLLLIARKLEIKWLKDFLTHSTDQEKRLPTKRVLFTICFLILTAAFSWYFFSGKI